MRRFALLSLSLALSFLTGGCHVCCNWGPRIEGSDRIVQETRDTATFHSVSLSGGMNLDIRVGLPQRVVIHADDNLQQYIRTEVEENELQIRFEESVSSSHTLRAEIDVRELKDLEIHGGATIDVIGVEGDRFSIDISGSCQGAVSGWVDQVSVDIAGSGDLDLFELQAKRAKVEISGSGKVKVHATETLDVDVAGSGDVTYRGEPRVSIDQAGSARVRAAN